jgi:hypothetical protein
MGSMICRLNRQMLLLFIDVAGVENGTRPVHALRCGSLGSLVWRSGRTAIGDRWPRGRRTIPRAKGGHVGRRNRRRITASGRFRNRMVC